MSKTSSDFALSQGKLSHGELLLREQLKWDERFMALALRLGRRGMGQTAENPSVGCVLVQQSPRGPVIIGQGHTQKSGRPHAERMALAQAGSAAKGATAYVTLEPCSHTGKSSPCSQALIEAGITRVVCAKGDPDPRVNGRGFAMLQDACIEVETGLMEEEATRDLAGFLSRTQTNRPWLVAKMAISADGYIGNRQQPNLAITGPEAKNRTYALRSRADAILVGVDTVLIDDPSLTVRLQGLEETSPIRIVLDSRGRLPLSSQLVQTAQSVPTWILTSGHISAEKALSLEARGCKVLLTDPTPSGHVNLDQALVLLAEEGINKLFIETGAILARTLLDKDLIDEFILYQGRCILGNGLRAFEQSANEALCAAGFYLDHQQWMGQDKAMTFLRKVPRF